MIYIFRTFKKDPDNIVGYIEPTDKGLLVTIRPGCELRDDQIRDLFGQCGYEIIEVFGDKISKLRIREWSI